jgi:hypothetical protein
MAVSATKNGKCPNGPKFTLRFWQIRIAYPVFSKRENIPGAEGFFLFGVRLYHFPAYSALASDGDRIEAVSGYETWQLPTRESGPPSYHLVFLLRYEIACRWFFPKNESKSQVLSLHQSRLCRFQPIVSLPQMGDKDGMTGVSGYEKTVTAGQRKMARGYLVFFCQYE